MTDDIRDWLRSIGLSEYIDAFVENAVDHELLPHLTNEDLKDLGIARLGDRKKLLLAIEQLEPKKETQSEEMAGLDVSSADRGEAERRQLTVMFCDLVGSTALSTRLDPEDLRDVLRAYQQACGEVVEDFDGHVARYIGDGILIYFGFPQAHEDDAQRAVHTALGILAGLGPLNQRLAGEHGVELGIRIGIHTGLVVVGEMGGDELRETDVIVGETPNIAARLQDLAAANSVVVSASTRHLIEGLFVFDALGPQPLKGISEPVPVFRVVGLSDAPSRFEAAAERGLSSLVGRKSEIDLLLDRWERTKEGEAQVVLLSGEPGVGKSRIVRALRERLETGPHSRILYYCSPYHQNSAFYPAVGQLERALRFEVSDGVEEKLIKLEGIISQLSLPVSELAPLLASLLSLPAEGRYPPQEVSPQLIRRRTLEALLSVIEAMAARNPVLMVVEDAHWIDPSTQEFLGLLIERMRSARVFLLVTHRPGFDAAWGSHTHITALRLNRLGRKEGAALITEVAGGKLLPDEVLEQIVERTDGVPLFAEELTKTVLESGLLTEQNGSYVLNGPLPPLAIPASLQDSLMERLDRLASAKGVAQLAATLGRTFSYGLLAAVSPLQSQELEKALDELEAAELVYQRGVAPDITYEFKHALIQDAAYQSMLKSIRQRHHERIAQVLQEAFPATADSEPESLAHHYTEAGLAGLAINYWLNAGQRAMQRSANVEAEGHLRKGLTVLEGMPETAERHQREIALHNALGVCLMPTRGFGNPDVSEAFSKAAAISEQQGDARGLFVALRGKGQYQMISGNLSTAKQQMGRVLDLAEEVDDPGILIEAHHLAWSALSFTADFAAARKHAETGIALYDRERDHHLTYIYSGHDPGVCCRSFGSLALWQLGYPDQALQTCRDGEALARELSHPFTVTIAYWATGMLHLLRRETGAVRETGDAMILHCTEKGFPPFVPMGNIFRGGARAEAGELAKGIAELRDGIDGMQAVGTQYTLPLFFTWLGGLFAASGQIDEGLNALAEGLAMSEKNEDKFSLPEFHRIRGDLLLAKSTSNKVEAEACFKQAIEIAHSQEARSLALRAATSLARFLRDQGRSAEAHETLVPIYDWFTEGFDTPDLKDARALLDELS